MIGKLSPEEIETVLQSNTLGRIGCNDGSKTYIVPISYAYDGKCILAHSVEGMKIKIMRKNPEVCFEVEDVKDITHWKSVIVWGKFQELTHERERYYALKLFVDRILHIKPKITNAIISPAEQQLHSPAVENIRPVIYRIIITEKTGRFERD